MKTFVDEIKKSLNEIPEVAGCGLINQINQINKFHLIENLWICCWLINLIPPAIPPPANLISANKFKLISEWSQKLIADVSNEFICWITEI